MLGSSGSRGALAALGIALFTDCKDNDSEGLALGAHL